MSQTKPLQRPRAIALITTMAGIAVIIMLVGAFLSTRQSLIAMTRFTAEQQACRDSLRSVADTCRFRLEGQAKWALVAGDSADTIEFRNGAGDVVFLLEAISKAQAKERPEFDSLGGQAFFAGKAPGASVDLQMTVSNNLESDVANPSFGVAAKSCLLRIRASRGAAHETVEILLRRAAFFDSTVAASEEIEIDADKVDFSSNDPLRNQIRSKADILLPDVPYITFTPDDDMQTPEEGTIWAKGDITVGGATGEDKLRQAADQTGGEFLPLAPTQYSVPELKKSDLDADNKKPIFRLDSATYEFRLQNVSYKDTLGKLRLRPLPVLVISRPSEHDDGSDSFLEFHFAEGALEQPIDPENPVPLDHVADPTTVTMEVGSLPVSGIDHLDPTFEISAGPKVTLPLHSKQQPVLELAAENDNRVGYSETTGELKIRAYNLPPVALVFKDNDPIPGKPQEGILSVGRDLIIEGHVGNCGKLLAGRDVRLMPGDLTVDKLEHASDLAVFGGRDVLIAPPFSPDEDVLEAAHRYFVFKGLVYAGRNFKFLSSMKRNGRTIDYNRKLYIEGALVARTGSVFIQGNEKVELKYNREYLDDLLETSFDEDHVQVEELSWRPL